MKGEKQFEIEVVGYADDTHEKIMYRADIILNSRGVSSAFQEATMIYNNPNAVIVAVVNLEEARNRNTRFSRGEIDEN